MRLYEFEGKNIVKKYGISVPGSILVKDKDDLDKINVTNGVVKAQLLIVKSRARARAVVLCDSTNELKNESVRLLENPVEGENTNSVLVEEKIDIQNEFYAGVTYDTATRTPVIIFDKFGGVDVESSLGLHKLHVNPTIGLQDWTIREMIKKSGARQDLIVKLSDIVKRIYNCFINEDCKTLEINPIVETKDGKLIAVDVAMDLDDDASYRHKERNFGERSFKKLTERETAVKKANAADYRGTIKYIEFDGNIGFLAAGGGGSLTCMDALIQYGGKPSNYTEYSGNPSSEKVYELTKQILSKPGLKGLWIVGAIANFTRVDTTMEGITKALTEVKPNFPIIVRRSGPFEKEGLEILRNAAKEHDLDMKVHGKEMHMTESARLITEAARKFGE